MLLFDRRIEWADKHALQYGRTLQLQEPSTGLHIPPHEDGHS